VRLYSLYEPLKVFFYIGLILLLIALFGGGRLIWFWFKLEGQNWRQTFERNTPTTIATVVALVFGFQIWLIGLIADLIASSRRLIEETLYRVKKLELNMDALEERGRTLVETLAPHPDEAASPNGSGPPAPGNGSAPAPPPTPASLASEPDRAAVIAPGERARQESAR
jgi:hypothetical protein